MKKTQETEISQQLPVCTATELSTLQECEHAIEAGLNAYMKAGNALTVIKLKKLYRNTHNTYEEYCLQRWNFTPQHANRLIKAANTTKIIEKSEPTGSVLPQSEKQVRILSTAKDPGATWKSTQEKTGKEQPTAKDIEAHLQDKEDKDTFDAEIIEEVPTDAAAITTSYSLLAEMVDIQYEMGIRTGRPQVSVESDDVTVARLNELKNQLQIPKAYIVAQSLLLMERFLDLEDPANAIY